MGYKIGDALDLDQFRSVLSAQSHMQRDADKDELAYLKRFCPHAEGIYQRFHVDGPGNWIIIYHTGGDVRVCNFASYGEYGEPSPHVVWDHSAGER